MYQHFRGKDTKDVEMAEETIIHKFNPGYNAMNKNSSNITLKVSEQQNLAESFDTFIDKRNKG